LVTTGTRTGGWTRSAGVAKHFLGTSSNARLELIYTYIQLVVPQVIETDDKEIIMPLSQEEQTRYIALQEKVKAMKAEDFAGFLEGHAVAMFIEICLAQLSAEGKKTLFQSLKAGYPELWPQ
jgi:hypothetical protein